MCEMWKMILKAEDYPDNVRVVPLAKGDTFYLTGSRDVKVGDKYEDYPAIISHIDYKRKRWWQFWKKREMLGCLILWLGNE